MATRRAESCASWTSRLHSTALFFAVLVCLLGEETVRAQNAPSITTDLTNEMVVVGSNATLSVSVSGTGPFTYEWLFNGASFKIIQTVAGNGRGGYSGDGGLAIEAELGTPVSVAVDGLGNIFIAEWDNNRIRKVAASGIITTVAGNGVLGYSGDGGPATNAELWSPDGVAVDSLGNLFIADVGNNRIRKVGSNGIITTVAGNGAIDYSGDGGFATNAALYYPSGVAVGASGNLFIADWFFGVVRKVDANGIITIVAGGGSSYLGDGGFATNAELDDPYGVAVDRIGNLFIADDSDQRIRKVGTNGIISTVAGNGLEGFFGDGSFATNAELNYPESLAVDSMGGIFVSDFNNNRVREVSTNGIITTVAGNGSYGYSGDGGPASSADVNSYHLSGVAVDSIGNLFIADSGNDAVRQVTSPNGPALSIGKVAGADAGDYSIIISNSYGSVTSSVAAMVVVFPPTIKSQPQNRSAYLGSNVSFNVTASGTAPLDYQWQHDGTNLADGSLVSGSTSSNLLLTVAGVDQAGSYAVIVRNAYGSVTSAVATLTVLPTVEKQPLSQAIMAGGVATFSISVSGTPPFSYQWLFNGKPINIINTIAGNGIAGYSGDGGAATGAELKFPSGIAVDEADNLYIADYGNQRIRKVGTNGVISTVAGNGSSGYSGDNGVATNAMLFDPSGVAIDSFGNLFIADSDNNRIRKVDTNGIITTVAGINLSGFYGDGLQATRAELYSPYYVTFDSRGNLFIADTGNERIRRVGTNGIINTVAGNGSIGFSGDGNLATSAELHNPLGMAVDNIGNLFFADAFNNRIRKVTTNGNISTVAGNGIAGYSTPGDGGQAITNKLDDPNGVALDAFGNLYVADFTNNRIRKVWTNGIITTVAGNGLAGFSGEGGNATNAELSGPASVAVDGFGDIFIVDDRNQRIREVQNGPALTLNNLSFANAGQYSVVVSNAYGSVTSTVASLTVLSPPVITEQPENTGIVAGAAGAVTLSCAGTQPLEYQWYFDGLAVAGATNATLAFNPFEGTNSGSYKVVITNLYGAVTSDVAIVSQAFPPAIVSEPTGQSVLLGSGAAFSVGVSGTGPFTYQWQLNGTNLPAYLITTIAGNGVAGYSGDGGLASSAELKLPSGVAADAFGNIFITDNGNERVRKVGTNGLIITVAGGGVQFPGDGGAATNVLLGSPTGIAADALGNVLIAETSHQRIRKVATNGIISTVAGRGVLGFTGDGGKATNAEINNPSGVTVDPVGNIFIADTANQRIRKVATNGVIATVAGDGSAQYSGDGGPATNAAINAPHGVFADEHGNLVIADSADNRIRKVDTNGIINTIAGTAISGYSGDGRTATNAEMSNPSAIAIDAAGNVFIADTGNNRVREIGTNNIITTVAGNGGEVAKDGGAATNSGLSEPAGLVLDGAGGLLIADTGNNRVRKVTPSNLPTLTFSGIPPELAGNYSVVVSSSFGSVTSSVVALTVASSPIIVAQPQDAFVIESSNALMTVGAVGAPPLSYQWFFDGASLAAGTNSTLSLLNVQGTNTGSYDVVVSNSYGSVTSSVATLTVVLAPLNAAVVPPSGTNTTLAVQFQFSGIPGTDYVLEYTTNLVPPFLWIPLVTNAPDGSGNWTFIDTGAGSFPARFFRTALAQ